MSRLRDWIDRHRLLAFLLLAYGLSWGLWAAMIAVWGRINWLGSFGPSAAAIIVIAITQGRAGLAGLWRLILAWRFGLTWYAFIILGCVLILLLGLWLYVFLGRVIVLPRDKIAAQLVLVPIYYLIVLVIGGPLGEEIGWRGFLLPHFLKSFSPLIASLLLAVIWLGWHLPLFWLPGASQAGLSIGAFALFIGAWSVLFTWVYLGTHRSLLAALLLHSSINTYSLIMSETDPAHAEGPFLAYAAVAALVALIVIVADRRLSWSAREGPASSPPH